MEGTAIRDKDPGYWRLSEKRHPPRKPGNLHFINIGALPHRWICWDRISASDWPPASAKLKIPTRNVTPRLSRDFDFSKLATITLKLFASHVLLFIRVCAQNYSVLLLLLLLLEYDLFLLKICFPFTLTWFLRNILE